MTAPDVRTAAQAEAEFALIEAARDEAVAQGFSHGCDCGASEVNAFSWGAVWGAALVTPTREQIAEALWCFPINAITLSELREKAATGNGDYEETLDYLMHQADAVLVLMRAQAGEARAANP